MLTPSPSRFIPGERNPVPIVQKADWNSGRSGQAWKILSPLVFETRTAQPVASHYTGYVIPATYIAYLQSSCSPENVVDKVLWSEIITMPHEGVWKNFRPRMLIHLHPDIVKARLLQNNLNFSEDVITWIHICPKSLTPNFKLLNSICFRVPPNRQSICRFERNRWKRFCNKQKELLQDRCATSFCDQNYSFFCCKATLTMVRKAI